MALKLIESDKLLKAVKPGDGRLSDGGGLYLLPTAKEGGLHGWRFDYTFEMRRKTLSFGTYPAVSLDVARTRAREARQKLAEGTNPSAERKQKRAVIAAQVEADRRIEAGLPVIGSFEDVARRWYAKRSKKWM